MSYLKTNTNLNIITEEVKDISSSSTFKSSPLKDDKYFIIHHTAGRGTAMDVMNVLNSRHLGVQWIIDRDGKLYKSLPSGHRGAHIKLIKSSVPKDLNNRTTQGVEIIAKNDSDILITQCRTALKLIKSLGYSPSNVYGHGDVSTNRGPEEGRTCKAYVKKYWNTPESKLPGTDARIGKLGDKKGEENKSKDSGFGDLLSGLKDTLMGIFKEEIENNIFESNKINLDLLIEKEIKKITKQKLIESETYGFPTGQVNTNKVVTGGLNDDWGGSMPKALEIAKIAADCAHKKEIIMSQKRTRKNTASGGISDHYIDNETAYAVDITAKGESGDKLLACIMKKWDNGSHSDYDGGKWIDVKKDGYRYQFGWRVPGHYDHIHVGVKKLGVKSKSSQTKSGTEGKDQESSMSLLDQIKNFLKSITS